MILFVPTGPQAQTDSTFKLEDDQSYDAYRVRIYRNKEEGTGYFEILQNGKRVYFQKGFRFKIGLLYADAEYEKNINNDLIRMGKNITGNGVPNLVVNEWSGGAHCCYKYFIFEIGKHFKKIATLDAGDGDGAHFEDRRRDNRLQFIANDWTFAYWHTDFADSPAPDIILTYQYGSYILDFNLMRKPPPTQMEIEDKIKAVQKDDSWKEKEAPPILWGYMLDLIYSGNADVAWKFFDKGWLPGIPGKESFKHDFQSRLRKSPYWNQIEEMNKLTKKVS
jgi:hypothetical protein